MSYRDGTGWSVQTKSKEVLLGAVKEFAENEREQIKANKEVKLTDAQRDREERLANKEAEREERKLAKEMERQERNREKEEKQREREANRSDAENERLVKQLEITSKKEVHLKILETCAEKDYELQSHKVDKMTEIIMDKSSKTLEFAKMAHEQKMLQLKNENQNMKRIGVKNLSIRNARSGLGDFRNAIQDSGSAALAFQANPAIQFGDGNAHGGLALPCNGNSSQNQLQYSGSGSAPGNGSRLSISSMGSDAESLSGISSSAAHGGNWVQSNDQGRFSQQQIDEPQVELDLDIDSSIELEAYRISQEQEVNLKKLDNELATIERGADSEGKRDDREERKLAMEEMKLEMEMEERRIALDERKLKVQVRVKYT